MQENDKKFHRILRNKFENFERTPPVSWKNLNQKILDNSMQTPRAVVLKYAVVFVLGMLSGSFLLYYLKPQPDNVVHETKYLSLRNDQLPEVKALNPFTLSNLPDKQINAPSKKIEITSGENRNYKKSAKNEFSSARKENFMPHQNQEASDKLIYSASHNEDSPHSLYAATSVSGSPEKQLTKYASISKISGELNNEKQSYKPSALPLEIESKNSTNNRAQGNLVVENNPEIVFDQYTTEAIVKQIFNEDLKLNSQKNAMHSDTSTEKSIANTEKEKSPKDSATVPPELNNVALAKTAKSVAARMMDLRHRPYSKFTFEVFAAPEISNRKLTSLNTQSNDWVESRNQRESHSSGWSAGGQVNYTLFPFLSIGSGIIFTATKYNGAYKDPLQRKDINYTSSENMLGVPLNLNLFLRVKRFSFSITNGLVLYKNVAAHNLSNSENTYFSKVANANGPGMNMNRDTDDDGDDDDDDDDMKKYHYVKHSAPFLTDRNFMLAYNSSVSLNYLVRERFSIAVGPSLRYFVTSVYKQNNVKEHPYNMGIQLSGKYYF